MNLKQDNLIVKFFKHVVSFFSTILSLFLRISTRSIAIPTIRFVGPMLADDLGCGRRSEFRFKFKKLEKKDTVCNFTSSAEEYFEISERAGSSSAGSEFKE
jgi:hypothetical protein